MLILVTLVILISQIHSFEFDPAQEFAHAHSHHKIYIEPTPKRIRTAAELNITKYPVVLIPGDGGNQLHGKLNKTSAPHYFCKLQSSDYYELWLNLEEITPYVIDCLVDNLRLLYDNQTNTSHNREGVDIMVKDFGNTSTVEFLDSSQYSITVYFGAIANALVKKYDYVRGLNIRGAPYDWRKAPNEMGDYYKNLTKLVEETYEANNK